MKQNIDKHIKACIIFLLYTWHVALNAQTLHTVEARVTDASTGKALPFATIYATKDKATITNAEGWFKIDVGNNDSLRVSFVGYKPITIKTANIKKEIKLNLASKDIAEIVVKPTHKRIEEIIRTAIRQMKETKNTEADFLYRQTTEVNYNTTSIVEAFIRAKAAFTIRDMKLITGRYSALDIKDKNLLSHSANFHPLSQISIVCSNDYFERNECIVPLYHDYRYYYNTKYDIINDGNKTIYVIKFIPKGNYRQQIFNGTIYVDAKDLRLLKAEGTIDNTYIINNSNNKNATLLPAEIYFSVIYKEHHFAGEIESVAVSAYYSNSTTEYAFRSFMYNIGEKKHGQTIKLKGFKDLRKQIAGIGYDKNFWKKNETVKRTQAELQLTEETQQEIKDTTYTIHSTGSGTERLRDFVNNIERFNRYFPQEKVYLHFDNTGYFKGERIWFKAYVTRADNNRRTDMSRVLYVELLNPIGDVVETCKLKINEGQADGNIRLDSILNSGFYEVRAYTRYMLNWSRNGIFSRVFPVFNAPKKEGEYKRVINDVEYRKRLPDNREKEEDKDGTDGRISVRFYPEGGRLVKGLKSNVAFEVLSKTGEAADTEGRIETDNDTTEVRTIREGRGIFGYTPGERPATMIIRDTKGKEQRFILPEAEQEGCVIRVNTMDDDNIEVEMERSRGYKRDITMVLINGGNVEAFTVVEGEEDCTVRTFKKRQMSSGVNQIALIDDEGNIMAERMVFIYPQKNDMESIEVRPITKTITPCGKIELEAEARPFTTFSMSVRDCATDGNGYSQNAATWMLISSDLKGYIRNAEYYLEADDREHRKAADLLMMVQGWKRYDVKMMIGRKTFVKNHPIEDELFIMGRLHQKKKRNTVDKVRLNATLYNREGASFSGETITDKKGYYTFKMPECTGEFSLLLNTKKNDKAVKYNIGIDRNFSPNARKLSPYETRQQEQNIKTLDIKAGYEFEEHIPMDKDNHLLKEVKVKGKKRRSTGSRWLNEHNGAYKATIKYDCMKAADEILDRGESTPEIYEWLAMTNSFFQNSKDGKTASTNSSSENSILGTAQQNNTSKASNRGVFDLSKTNDEKQDITHKGLIVDGIRYKNRPIIWILNNEINAVTGLSESAVKSIGNEFKKFGIEIQWSLYEMPTWLEDFKSIYISEDDNIWKNYITSNNLGTYHPVTIFVYVPYTHKVKHKGLRQTVFYGYNKTETFEMPDYSKIPPMTDHRRTLYWNPNVTTDNKGKAIIRFYNNSTCQQIAVSAEGITEKGMPIVY